MKLIDDRNLGGCDPADRRLGTVPSVRLVFARIGDGVRAPRGKASANVSMIKAPSGGGALHGCVDLVDRGEIVIRNCIVAFPRFGSAPQIAGTTYDTGSHYSGFVPRSANLF